MRAAARALAAWVPHAPAIGGGVTYAALAAAAARGAAGLRRGGIAPGARVGVLAPPTAPFAAGLLAAWAAGAIAVPLSLHHRGAELAYTLRDAGCRAVLAHPLLAARLPPDAAVDVQLLPAALDAATGATDPPGPLAGPLIIYTSGTTGRPKGVLLTQQNVQAQISTLLGAWEWSARDRIYNVLPLHHVHGLVNVLLCGLNAGACVEMPEKFDPAATWERFLGGNLTLFMAVPTVYSLLIAEYNKQPPAVQTQYRNSLRQLRLMVCGSAALPVPIMERWEDISGHRLLERYGMTELGMALSNPLHGPRIPGHVGRPLAGVEENASAGELLVRGPGVFCEYWGRPDATKEAFTPDGFFRTGDIAAYNSELDSYAILGRASVDIIKSGGYKLSALEIERVILSHPAVAECAVLGIPDDIWGEKVVALVVPAPGKADVTEDALQTFCATQLASYKMPRKVVLVANLEKNALGKLNKKNLRESLLKQDK